MESFGLSVVLSAMFAAPTVLVGISVAAYRRKPAIYSPELASWLAPGIVYWLLLEPLDLEQAFRGKGLGNAFLEPAIIGLLTGALFLIRLTIATYQPSWNKQAAWACAAASSVAALVVFVLTPAVE